MIRERAGFVKKGLGKWQTFCYNKHTCIKACKFVSDKGVSNGMAGRLNGWTIERLGG